MRVREHDDRPLPAEYEWLVGSKLGSVERLHLWYPERGGPQVYLGTATAADVGALRGEDVPGFDGGGKGLTAREALRSAVGEAVERYCLFWPDGDRIERATRDGLASGRTAVDLDAVDVMARRVDGIGRPVDSGARLSWTPGADLLTGETTWVPAQLVWSRTGPLADETRYFPGTTSGAAAGPGLRDAVLGGLTELVERDALVRTWLDRSPPRRLDLDAVPGLRARVDDLLPLDRFEVHVLALESQVDLPVYGVALVNERDAYPKFVFGSAAGTDPRSTVEDALVEVSQAWRRVHELATERDPASVDPDGEITNLDDNVVLYGRPDQFEHVAFLVDGEATDVRRRGVEGDELAGCLARLRDADCTPVAVDVTTPDVAAAGIRVVQAVVPELVPLCPPSVVPARHPRVDADAPPDVPHPYP